MKKLAAILFMTLVGSIAQAIPFEPPAEFADYQCTHADDSEKCRAEIEADSSTKTMNHFSITLRICSPSNTETDWKRSTCFAKIARAMKDRDFLQRVTDCRNDENFWGNGPKNETWKETADCQSKVYSKQAAEIDRKGSGGSRSHGSQVHR